MIYIIGDTHIPTDAHKLIDIDDRLMSKDDDYVIICGDVGLLWTKGPDKDETRWKKILDNKNFTTLFVDGNHENHDRLDKLSTIDLFGGTVGVVSNSIFHLKRGQVYTIKNRTFFCMGGAFSVDAWHLQEDLITGKRIKVWDRIPGKSWWSQEQPSVRQMIDGFKNLQEHGMKVDYVISHTCPQKIANLYLLVKGRRSLSEKDFLSGKIRETEYYLDRILDRLQFKNWFFGHWHDDWSTYDYKDGIKRNIHMLYYNMKCIEELEDPGNFTLLE